jgi:hypothetical protein
MLQNMLHVKGEYRRYRRPCGLKPQVCSPLAVGIAVSNAAVCMECSSLAFPVCCVGSGLCDELMIRSEGPYHVCVFVCLKVCDL